MSSVSEQLVAVCKAKQTIASLSSEQKNAALESLACALEDNCSQILKANEADLAAAQGTVKDVMLDRLMLNRDRVFEMATGVREVAALDDPAGKILDEFEPIEGLKVQRVSVPLGVVAIIFESRPNVTADAAALCLKSGNACILRGGKEAHATCQAITDALRSGLERVGIMPDAINLVEDTSRESSAELMRARGMVDVLIPRGGAGLIQACVDNALVPVIATGTGICHVYIHETADVEMAVRIVENAKTSRPSVCNAEEVLLVDKAIASEVLPKIAEALVDKRIEQGVTPVELRVSEEAARYIAGTPATERDFDTEFLDYILAVHVVDGLESAIEHIAAHSTGHSEAIVTTSEEAAKRFTQAVDSSSVYVNASTRFTDGGQFGLGCEIGISTQKLHARGPMGLRELTTYKYVIHGQGNIR